jgi:hypothetical protein
MLPWLVAKASGHHQQDAIGVRTLLLGWTLLRRFRLAPLPDHADLKKTYSGLQMIAAYCRVAVWHHIPKSYESVS